MGTTLTGTTPQDTYDSLIKVTDNGPLSGTAKYLSDGLGNDSVLALSTSRVGVGTNAPSYDLTLSKSVAAGNVVLQIENTSTTGSARLWFGNNANAAGARIQYFGATHAQRPNLFSIGTDVANDVMFETSGSERMRITSAGNVGIGTSSPLERLVVSGGCLQVTGALSSLDRASSSVVDFFNGSSRIFSIGANASTHGNISFNTATTAGTLERAIITSDGYLRLTVNSGGIQFNGDTAAANALDDYEEGTWTMGVSFGGASVGVTYSQNTGTYTKIGRQVTVNGLLALTSKGSSTGSAKITGLPFTIGSGIPNFAAASLRIEAITFANQFQALASVNSTNIELEEVTEAGVNTTLSDADFANNSTIMIGLTYFV